MFTLSGTFLSNEEQRIFESCLEYHGLDQSVWDIFSALFKSDVRHTRPVILRIYRGGKLNGAIILVKCSHYGRALFNNRLLSWLINLLSIPYYQWIRFGCCMDMMSNPGFVKDPEQTEEVLKAAVRFMKQHKLLTIITDYAANSFLYESASTLEALPHAVIDCTEIKEIEDYLKDHKNIKRKMRVFEIKGGGYSQVYQSMDNEQIAGLEKCFLSTAKKSVFYLPYQELYLRSAITTSKTIIENAVYFIATLDEEFIGYQAALKTGHHLNALHGAFDRNLKTTYHAYDILFVKMTEYALDNGLKICDYGAVLNHTKQKMVNKTVDMSYFLLSKYPMIQKVFSRLLSITKIQGEDQLKFRSIE